MSWQLAQHRHAQAQLEVAPLAQRLVHDGQLDQRQHAQEDQQADGRGQALAGGQPKSADLLAAGPDTQWLHIAGHAVYDPHDPLASALQLGEGETLSARAIIARLTLGADLVTLSACASGVTHVVPGDELLGLQRAFLYAGAPAVVCAQWEAADLVTLLLMDRFYAGLLAGQAPAAALRDAQAALRATSTALLPPKVNWRRCAKCRSPLAMSVSAFHGERAALAVLSAGAEVCCAASGVGGAQASNRHGSRAVVQRNMDGGWGGECIRVVSPDRQGIATR